MCVRVSWWPASAMAYWTFTPGCSERCVEGASERGEVGAPRARRVGLNGVAPLGRLGRRTSRPLGCSNCSFLRALAQHALRAGAFAVASAERPSSYAISRRRPSNPPSVDPQFTGTQYDDTPLLAAAQS